jgi:Ca2+-binding RTX toxin-like protein
VPDGPAGGAVTATAANPYPSSISISGLGTSVTDMNVTLCGFSATFPSDVDILLVSPSGANAVIMSDAGGDGENDVLITNVTFTLDDQVANQLPADFPITTGTFRPVDDDDEVSPLWTARRHMESLRDGRFRQRGRRRAPAADLLLRLEHRHPHQRYDNLELIDDDLLVDHPSTSTTSTTQPTTTSSSTTTIVPTTCDGLAATIRGTGGNDTLTGTAGNDVVVGGGGHDVINGGGGDDVICGDDGVDRLFGDDGNDRIFGGTGTDTLDGGSGNDALFGEAGVDRLLGGPGDDALTGGPDYDNCLGGTGTDTAAT